MLKKLLKYEFLATGRLMILIYLAVLAVSAVTGLLGRLADWDSAASNPILFSIFVVIYVLLVVAMIVLTVFMIIERFYKNILRGEGYLMHTLPVPTWMLIVSKLICAFVWEILAVAVLIWSLILFSGLSGTWVLFAEVFYEPEFLEFMRMNAGYFVLFIFMVVAQCVEIILTFYASMAIGGAATRHKLAYSFLAFVVILIAENVINVVSSLGMATNVVVSNLFQIANDEFDFGSAVTRIMTRQLVFSLIFAVIFYLITHYFLKKKLNLE